MTNAIRILGLDPGLRHTGWGVISVQGSRLSHVAHGVIRPDDSRPLAERLTFLFDAVAAVIAEHEPHEAAIEETFVNNNPSSTLKLGHARAAAMIAPAKAGLLVAEYAATVVKKSVVGTGNADKAQVAFMIKRLLPTAGDPKADAADALAVAICHANSRTARGAGRMIGRLRGELAEVGEEEAVVDVGGVGYVVRCGSRTLSRMPPIGDLVMLHIDSQTREDGTRLYGFLSREDRQAFVILMGVQGVGPKAALSVLDVLSPGELAAAVAREDKALVGRAQGVGPKLAQRIVVELKDKPIGAGDIAAFHAQVSAAAAPAVPSVAGEAVAALRGLGTPEAVGRRAVEKALERLGEGAPLQAVIKGALQELGR